MAGRVEFIRPKPVFFASLAECTQSISCGHGAGSHRAFTYNI